jgi:hypothetical protein
LFWIARKSISDKDGKMRKKIPFVIAPLLIILFLTVCDFIDRGDPSLDATRVAIAVQQNSQAHGQNPQVEQPQSQVNQPSQPTYTLYPTFTQEAPPPGKPPEEVLFRNVITDTTEFGCGNPPLPSTLTITVEMSDVDRGAILFWRLNEKGGDFKSDWYPVDMGRAGENKRTYTFGSKVSAIFAYPDWIGASWFEFQIVSNDGADRTEVFAEVTFYPCPY